MKWNKRPKINDIEMAIKRRSNESRSEFVAHVLNEWCIVQAKPNVSFLSLSLCTEGENKLTTTMLFIYWHSNVNIDFYRVQDGVTFSSLFFLIHFISALFETERQTNCNIMCQ